MKLNRVLLTSSGFLIMSAIAASSASAENRIIDANRSVPEEDQWIGMANSASERLAPKGTQP